jgi:hypothetical protein
MHFLRISDPEPQTVLGTRDILVPIRISGAVPLTNESGSNFLLKFCVKILVFCKRYFSPLNTFMRKGKDPDPVWGGPKNPDPNPQHWP